jgi:hypothetical protein
MSNGRTGHPAFESSPAESESTNGNRLVASPWHTILVISALSLNAYFGWLRASALRQATNVHRPAVYGRTVIGGLMAGTLAWWRRSVRPGMIAHTLQDLLALVVAH